MRERPAHRDTGGRGALCLSRAGAAGAGRRQLSPPPRTLDIGRGARMTSPAT